MKITRKLPALLISLALTLAIIPIMASPASASTAEQLTTQLNAINGLTATQSVNTVTVTGVASVAFTTLNIDSGVTVKWQANYTGQITLNGGGTFEVVSGTITSAQNPTLWATNNFTGNLIVSGGTIATTNTNGGSAITSGGSSLITITGGTITSEVVDSVSVSLTHSGSRAVITGGTLNATLAGVNAGSGSVAVLRDTVTINATNRSVVWGDSVVIEYSGAGPFTAGTSTGLTTNPSSVAATWDTPNVISFTNNTNTGTIAVPFGNVPNTSNHSVTWAIVLMGGFAVISAGLWVVVFRSRRKQKI
jgi:hypothetical protein